MPSHAFPVPGPFSVESQEPATGLEAAPGGDLEAGSVQGSVTESAAVAKMPAGQSAAGLQPGAAAMQAPADDVASVPLAASATAVVPGGSTQPPEPVALAGPESEADAEPVEPVAPVETVVAVVGRAGAEGKAQLLAPLASAPVTPQGIGASLMPRAAMTGPESVNGAATLAVENTGSRGMQSPPINRQLVGPIAVLATGPHGDRTLSINIAPEALGPVTVKAHLGQEGLRVELTAPTEAGREALRAMLPELRRDLAATGAGNITIGTNSDNATGPGSGGANPGTTGDQRFGTGVPGYPPRGRSADALPADAPAAGTAATTQHSTHLDVMA